MTKLWGIDEISIKKPRYSGDHTFFCKKIQKNEENCQNSCFSGNSGNSGGDGLLNSNHRGTGRGKTAGDLGERVPRGIPKRTQAQEQSFNS